MVKTCIIIAGPTAIGKTSLAVSVAQQFSTQIISADSRQCFRELSIGVAKPSAAECSLVPHHFISSHSIHDNVNAVVFENYALDKVQDIFLHNDIAVMVGGTGLYIKAFCEGMDQVPPASDNIKEKIAQDFATHGLPWLQEQIQQEDPLYYAQGEIKNPQRLMRALEVKLSTGRSIIELQTKQKITRDFNMIKIGLQLPREELYQRINYRVDEMITQGLREEVGSLLPVKHLNALQTVGYRELFSFFNGAFSLSQAIDAIKLNTRHYAKRQMTWFKKDAGIKWCAPELAQVMLQIKSAL